MYSVVCVRLCNGIRLRMHRTQCRRRLTNNNSKALLYQQVENCRGWFGQNDNCQKVVQFYTDLLFVLVVYMNHERIHIYIKDHCYTAIICM